MLQPSFHSSGWDERNLKHVGGGDGLHQQPLGVIENPLYDGSGSSRKNLARRTKSAPVSKQTARQQSHQSTASSIAAGIVARSKSMKEYIKKETATFFGVNSDTWHDSCQRWTERRKRLLSKKCGELKDQYVPSSERTSSQTQQGAIALHSMRDSFSAPQRCTGYDATDAASSSLTLSSANEAEKQRLKEPVYKLTLEGLSFLATTIARWSSQKREAVRLRSLSTNHTQYGDDDVFYEDSAESRTSSSQVQNYLAVEATSGTDFFDKPSGLHRLSLHSTAESREPWPLRRIDEIQTRGFRHLERTEETRPPNFVWHRPSSIVETDQPDVGGSRIWNKLLERALDNSNRRQYGMGVVGEFFHRRFRRDRITPDVKEQLDDIDDHRPYFTYWVTTVQILITVISLAVYGFGPVGFHKTQKSSLNPCKWRCARKEAVDEVLVTSLSLQQVDYFEPDNFWIGPRAADLVHLGAKFTPCMRKDKHIYDEIAKDRNDERDTACCIRNDESGCVQTSRDKCSEIISTWRKWNRNDPGPPRWVSDPARDSDNTPHRLSGPVCGQDPRYCEEPASVYPYEWPDDITKWPICRRRMKVKKAAEAHMACEVIGRPCCIGIYGECRITTKEYCDFVKGFFHEEATLCSQVSCLDDVCGMIPFFDPEAPDQFYRLWMSLFLHAGIVHLAITVIVQYFIMRDLEKLAGPIRIGIIYIMSGVAGNLASAIFVPYRAEVGPAGAQFGLLACLFVEVIHCWQMLKKPEIALLRLAGVALVLFLIGLLPWVDNYAHLFGFIFGFLLSYALLPFLSFGVYDRTTKIILIIVCLLVVVVLFVGLLVLFYVHPVYECSFCKYFSCIPITRDFCESQDIKITRSEI